ncbi:MAG TPA: hypothetical protein DDX98_12525 [Bacteroidales bacterium]|nr:hypothetical protein [Bacteroidales bacterium]
MNDHNQKYLSDRFYSGYVEHKTAWQRLKEHRLARKFATTSKKAIDKTMRASGQEARETKEMAQAFFKLLESKLDLSNRKEPPSPEEVKAAIEQLKDVGRFSFFTAVSILPGGGAGLIGIELLARKFGVKNFTFMPSAFRDEIYKTKGKTDST